MECEPCHKDAHDGQFIAKDGTTRCADCHTAQRWAPSTFDHDKTHLPLTGGHAAVACIKCHTQTKQIADKQIVIYKNCPTKCIDCHGNNPKIMENAPPT